jgi:hypothetical protein
MQTVRKLCRARVLASRRGLRNKFEGVTEDQLAFQIVPSTGISHMRAYSSVG